MSTIDRGPHAPARPIALNRDAALTREFAGSESRGTGIATHHAIEFAASRRRTWPKFGRAGAVGSSAKGPGVIQLERSGYTLNLKRYNLNSLENLYVKYAKKVPRIVPICDRDSSDTSLDFLSTGRSFGPELQRPAMRNGTSVVPARLGGRSTRRSSRSSVPGT